MVRPGDSVVFQSGQMSLQRFQERMSQRSSSSGLSTMYLPSKVCLLATGPSCFIAFQKFAVTCEVCDTVEVELNTNPARQLASVLPGEEEKPVVQPGVGKSSESSESIGNVSFLVKL